MTERKQEPKLIRRFGAFNIVRVENDFFAVPLITGQLDLTDSDATVKNRIPSGQTEAEAMENAVAIYGSPHPPEWGGFLVETFGGFNIILWQDRYLGVPQELGPLDFATIDLNDYKAFIVEADTPENARKQLLDLYQGPLPHQWGMEHFIETNSSLEELDLPEVVEIDPIHACNLRCIMCHVPHEKLTGARLDADLLLRRLSGLTNRWFLLGATHEPAMHPEFGDIVEGLLEVGAKIDLTTNGTLLKPKLTERLKGAPIRIVTISFDGIQKETYESIRQGANFEKTVERIIALKEALTERQTYFNLNQTLLRRNIDEVVESVDFWEKAGFDHMGLILMRIRKITPELQAEVLEPVLDHAIARLEDAARRVIEKNFRIVLSSSAYQGSNLAEQFPGHIKGSLVHSSHPRYRIPFNPRQYFLDGRFPGFKVGCRSPFKFAKIHSNGDVQLCQRFRIGNINLDSFNDIWFGKRANRIRNTIMASPDICLSCNFFQYCIKGGEVDISNPSRFFEFRSIRRYVMETRLRGIPSTRELSFKISNRRHRKT